MTPQLQLVWGSLMMVCCCHTAIHVAVGSFLFPVCLSVFVWSVSVCLLFPIPLTSPPPPPPPPMTPKKNKKFFVRSVSARVSDLEADNAALRRDSCRSQQTEGILLLPKYRTQQVEPPSHPSFALPIHVRISKTAHPHLGPHLQLYSHLHLTLVISGLPSNEASNLPSPTIITHLHPQIENVHQPAIFRRFVTCVELIATIILIT